MYPFWTLSSSEKGGIRAPAKIMWLLAQLRISGQGQIFSRANLKWMPQKRETKRHGEKRNDHSVPSDGWQCGTNHVSMSGFESRPTCNPQRRSYHINKRQSKRKWYKSDSSDTCKGDVLIKQADNVFAWLAIWQKMVQLASFFRSISWSVSSY